jgi:hypothetical protein
MVLVLLVAAVALAATAMGGTRLTGVRIRAVRLLVAAAVVQVGTSLLAPGSSAVRTAALVVTAVLVGLFLLGNGRLPGVPLVALGLLLNVLVIALNGAMPVSVRAAADAGIARSELELAEDAMREPVTAGTRLWWLGDVVPVGIPRWPQVVSAGDVLVAAGVGLLLVTAGARRGPRSPQTPSRADRSTVCDSESTTVGSYS